MSTDVQIEVVLATRDALLKQREELETKAKQQSQDQSDIYQYLRKKLKDNYVAIAELETKVSRTAHTTNLFIDLRGSTGYHINKHTRLLDLPNSMSWKSSAEHEPPGCTKSSIVFGLSSSREDQNN